MYLSERFDIAKADLATAMLERMRLLAAKGGAIAAVTPQNWLFLVPYHLTLDTFCTEKSYHAIAGMMMLSVTRQSAAVAARPIRVR